MRTRDSASLLHQAVPGAAQLPRHCSPDAHTSLWLRACCDMFTAEWRACRWADLSEEAKDLLLRMLDYDPAKRITSKQARHPPLEQPPI